MIEYAHMPERSQQRLATDPFNRYLFRDGTVWTEFYRTDEGYVLRFPDLADFEVSASGKSVVVHPATGTNEGTIEHLYVNQVVPLALSRQGRPAFHASAVAVEGGAIAFLGRGGAGKSTLATHFSMHGSAFLTDDALIIEESETGCHILPSHASLRLWDDSIRALAVDDSEATRSVAYSRKSQLPASDSLPFLGEPQPLLAAYVLGPLYYDYATIRPLAGLDRYMGWLLNSYLLDIQDRDLLSQHFDWTHRISGAVPTFSLDYPLDYSQLNRVQRTIIEHTAQLDTKP